MLGDEREVDHESRGQKVLDYLSSEEKFGRCCCTTFLKLKKWTEEGETDRGEDEVVVVDVVVVVVAGVVGVACGRWVDPESTAYLISSVVEGDVEVSYYLIILFSSCLVL